LQLKLDGYFSEDSNEKEREKELAGSFFLKDENNSRDLFNICDVDNGTFTGDVFLFNQTQVDSFGALCYSKIDGTLILNDLDNSQDKITDLAPLSNLNEVYISNQPENQVKGGIGIFCDELTSLTGLHNITRLGVLSIDNCNSLLNLEGLRNLTSIDNEYGAWLRITNNSSLESLFGINNLTKIESGNATALLNINNNNALTNLDALENLDFVNGRIVFSETCGATDGNICFNYNVVDYCGIRNLLISETYSEINWMPPIELDGYFMPSVQDIIDGNCSQ